MNFYDKYSEVYQRKTGYFDKLSVIIKPLLSNENKSPVSVLDIGCGFGDFLSSLEKIFKEQAKYHGLTLARHEFESIKKTKGFIDIKIGNQKKLLKIYKNNEKFDLIINFHTLSYVRQEEQLSVVKQMTEFLNPGGLLVVGVITSWIKSSDKVFQQGKGYVQFCYSPWIFKEIGDSCDIKEVINDSSHKYKIYIWKKKNKKPTSLTGLIISLYFYVLGCYNRRV